MATPEQAKRMREIRDIQDLIARRETKRKETIRRKGYVPKDEQTPTFREEIRSRGRTNEKTN